MGADLRPDELWRLTPYQLARVLEARAEADWERQALAVTQAWCAANWSRAKKLPPLRQVLPRRPRGKREVSRALRAAFKNWEGPRGRSDRRRPS